MPAFRIRVILGLSGENCRDAFRLLPKGARIFGQSEERKDANYYWQ